ALGAMVGARPVAVIAAELAAVVDVQLATAMPAAQKSRHQQFAFAGRAAGDGAGHAGGIVGDHPQVPLELVPGDVGSVVVLYQNFPLGHRFVHATPNALAAIDHADPAGRATEGIGAGIDRVGQDVVHDVVGGQTPDDALRLALARLDG